MIDPYMYNSLCKFSSFNYIMIKKSKTHSHFWEQPASILEILQVDILLLSFTEVGVLSAYKLESVTFKGFFLEKENKRMKNIAIVYISSKDISLLIFQELLSNIVILKIQRHKHRD